MTDSLWLIHMSHGCIMTCWKVPHNQPPPPNHLTPPPKDLVPYTEKRKFDDGIMEDFPPEKKQRLQNFPLANGIGRSAILSQFRNNQNFERRKIVNSVTDFHTEMSCEDFRIIYPIHEPKAVMESVYQNGIWFVKNERKVHFGFSMNPQKIHELNAKESILKFKSQKNIDKNVLKCSIKGVGIMLSSVFINGRRAQYNSSVRKARQSVQW